MDGGSTMPDERKEIVENQLDYLLTLPPRRRSLRDADLRGVLLTDANLDGLRGDNIRLVEADLSGATLRGARLVACDIRNANLTRTDLSQAMLRMCILDSARASGVEWHDTRIEDSSLQGADFSEASLRGIRLSESSWARASLRDAVLEDASGDGVGFRGADLRGAKLARVRLADADFRGADLTGADFSGADLTGADFRGAILEAVRWDGASCRSARFDEDDPWAEAALIALGMADLGSAEPPTEIVDSAQAAATAAAVAAALASQQAPDFDPSKLESELQKVASDWPELQSALRTMDLRAFARLLSTPTGGSRSGGSPSVEPLIQLLNELDRIDSDEPPEEWKALLQSLFPQLGDVKSQASLEELAASLPKSLGQQRKV